MQLKEGANLQGGKYRIVRLLGQGGFGITYLAENALLEKRVAIKEFFPKDFCGRDATSHLTLGTQNNADTVARLKERFVKEAKNIAKLDHPGIVRIHDIFEENNTAYYVMDYIEGESLSDIVKRSGPLSETKAVEYITKVGEALEYIHSRQMTHFDVKPANIMVRRSDDQPILIDFGLSKQYDTHGDATSTLMQAVSHGYSPIELYNLGSVTTFSPQTDVYSLGATLYYLLTGIVPPNASDLVEDRLSFPAAFPKNLQDAIEKAMSVSKSGRYKSIDFLINAIKVSYESDETKILQPNSEKVSKEKNKQHTALKKSKNKNRYVVIILVILLMIGGITAGMRYFNSSDYFYQEGVRKYNQKEYDEAYILLRKAADKGNTESLLALAEMNRYGLGIPMSNSNAFALYKQAVEKGNRKAINTLISLYDGHSFGTWQDIIDLYKKLALAGNAEAQYQLGKIYDGLYCYRVLKDIEEAKRWYARAAEQYKKDAESGDSYAQYKLAEMHELGHLPFNAGIVFEMYHKAALNGSTDAQYKLGLIYQNGNFGVKKNPELARKWLNKAANGGNAKALKELEKM